ncbi:hypothetical protein X757_32950 [Mesorhizobium sp. LSHC414A00]|nr:hypothetical protein X757_32950 [Mesorhizobium sp. LSHC414A00]
MAVARASYGIIISTLENSSVAAKDLKPSIGHSRALDTPMFLLDARILAPANPDRLQPLPAAIL